MTSPKSLPKPKKPKLFLLRRVMGDSMVPTLQPGNVVVAVWPRLIRRDDIVIVWHDGLEKIKRVTDSTAEMVFLVGDNPDASTDSRSFGWVDRKLIVGKVVWSG